MLRKQFQGDLGVETILVLDDVGFAVPDLRIVLGLIEGTGNEFDFGFHGESFELLAFDLALVFDGTKLAIGADYLDACPVRGVRTGGGLETMRAEVLVKPGTADQQ